MVILRVTGTIVAIVPVTILASAAALIALLAILIPSRASVAERLCRTLLTPATRLVAEPPRRRHPPPDQQS